MKYIKPRNDPEPKRGDDGRCNFSDPVTNSMWNWSRHISHDASHFYDHIHEYANGRMSIDELIEKHQEFATLIKNELSILLKIMKRAKKDAEKKAIIADKNKKEVAKPNQHNMAAG